MSNLLSQEEVDALLAGVGLSSKGEESSEKLSKPPAYVYDFKHPNRLTKDQLRSLRTIHESFAKAISTYLTATLRFIVDIRLSSIDQVTFREFTMAMSDIDCIWMFELLDNDGRGIIELSPSLVFIIIDKLFGGAGIPHGNMRPVTVIEQNVVKRIVERILQLWDEAWQKVYPLKTRVLSFETNPQLAQIAPLSETVVVFFLEVALMDEIYPVNICLPFFIMEPMIMSISDQGWMIRTTHKKNEKHKKIIGQVVKSSEISVAVELGRTDVTLQELLGLDAGDVIVLEQKTDQALSVKVGNQVRFLAKPGIVGKKKAVQISRVLI